MRKTISLLLTLAMCFCLCACGGRATGGSSANDSGSEKADAEAAAQALPNETGTETETQQAAAVREAQLQNLCGNWVDFYSRFAFGSDDVITIDKLSEDDVTWSESGDEITAFYGWKLIDDDGIPLLASSNAYYIREQDYQTYIDRYFVEVELTADNVGDYIGDCVRIGDCLDEWGEEQEHATVYHFRSLAYENGLILLNARDFLMEATFRYPSNEETCTYHGDPYAPIVYWHNHYDREFVASNREFVSINRVKGTLLFVRAEDVADNRFDGQNQRRVIELKNGMSFRSICFFEYDKSNVDYESNKY